MADQSQLTGLLSNPLFGVGMGLLQSRYDKDVNPYKAAMTGLMGAQTSQLGQEKRDLEAQERERMEQMRKIMEQYFKGRQPPMGPRAGGASSPWYTGMPDLHSKINMDIMQRIMEGG